MDIKELIKNEESLIAEKKSEIKTKNCFAGFYSPKSGAIKGLPDDDDDHIYPVISTCNYLDSHKDVHLDGSMTKTAKEQNHKVYYVADHQLKIDSIIATPQNVEIKIMSFAWKDLGKDFEGETECLIFKIPKDKIVHEKFMKINEAGEPLQNSIRMQYVKLELCVDSEDEDDKKYKERFDRYKELVVNIGEAKYFWAIKELKIFMEGSAVLFGSNDATPVKNTEAVSDTSNSEPSKDTQKTFIHLNIY